MRTSILKRRYRGRKSRMSTRADRHERWRSSGEEMGSSRRPRYQPRANAPGFPLRLAPSDHEEQSTSLTVCNYLHPGPSGKIACHSPASSSASPSRSVFAERPGSRHVGKDNAPLANVILNEDCEIVCHRRLPTGLYPLGSSIGDKTGFKKTG